MSIEITAADIKSYLIISSTEYDANLTSILSVWNDVVDFMIEDEYLNSATYENILKAGKILYICAKLRDVLPKNIMGRISERVEYIVGNIKTVIDSRSEKQSLSLDAMDILRPYLKDENLLTSSTETIIAEFSPVDVYKVADAIDESESYEW